MLLYAGQHERAPRWSGSRRQEWREGLGHGFIWVSTGKERQGRVNSLGLANMNNSGGLWAIGVVPSCLVPGPRMIRAEGYCLLEFMGQTEVCLCISLHMQGALLFPSPLRLSFGPRLHSFPKRTSRSSEQVITSWK